MQYFWGKEPARFVSGTPWEKADFEVIAKTTEIFPGFFKVPAAAIVPLGGTPAGERLVRGAWAWFSFSSLGRSGLPTCC